MLGILFSWLNFLFVFNFVGKLINNNWFNINVAMKLVGKTVLVCWIMLKTRSARLFSILIQILVQEQDLLMATGCLMTFNVSINYFFHSVSFSVELPLPSRARPFQRHLQRHPRFRRQLTICYRCHHHKTTNKSIRWRDKTEPKEKSFVEKSPPTTSTVPHNTRIKCYQ